VGGIVGNFLYSKKRERNSKGGEKLCGRGISEGARKCSKVASLGIEIVINSSVTENQTHDQTEVVCEEKMLWGARRGLTGAAAIRVRSSQKRKRHQKIWETIGTKNAPIRYKMKSWEAVMSHANAEGGDIPDRRPGKLFRTAFCGGGRRLTKL